LRAPLRITGRARLEGKAWALSDVALTVAVVVVIGGLLGLGASPVTPRRTISRAPVVHRVKGSSADAKLLTRPAVGHVVDCGCVADTVERGISPSTMDDYVDEADRLLRQEPGRIVDCVQ
jgi:hypothetical protein